MSKFWCGDKSMIFDTTEKLLTCLGGYQTLTTIIFGEIGRRERNSFENKVLNKLAIPKVKEKFWCLTYPARHGIFCMF